MNLWDNQQRQIALRLAVEAGDPGLRQQFYEFLTGKSDQTPRQIIEGALEAANVS